MSKGFSRSIGGSHGSQDITATSVNYNQSTHSGDYKPKAGFGAYAPKPDNSCGSSSPPPKPRPTK